MDALDDSLFLHLGFWDSTDTIGAKVCVSRLNTTQTAEIFVAGLLPFGDQILVRDALLQAELIQFLTDGLSLVIQVENVTGFLMVQLENGPHCFDFAFSFVGLGFGFPHLLVQLIQRRLNQIPSLRWRLGTTTDFRHGRRS
jgi:hypothetical protein